MKGEKSYNNKDRPQLEILAGCEDCALARIERPVMRIEDEIILEIIEEKCKWGGRIALAKGVDAPFGCNTLLLLGGVK